MMESFEFLVKNKMYYFIYIFKDYKHLIQIILYLEKLILQSKIKQKYYKKNWIQNSAC